MIPLYFKPLLYCKNRFKPNSDTLILQELKSTTQNHSKIFHLTPIHWGVMDNFVLDVAVSANLFVCEQHTQSRKAR